MDYKFDVEEAAYYLLALRTAEKQYQTATSKTKPLASAKLKRAVAEGDDWLKAYISTKKKGAPINEPVNQDFGSPQMVGVLETAAGNVLSHHAFVDEALTGPIGIARHDKATGLDYVLHFEKAPEEEKTAEPATREEVLQLIYDVRDKLDPVETIIIAGNSYKIRKTDDGQVVTLPGIKEEVLILPDGSTKNL